MASSIAAAPVIVDHQEQQSSSSSIPAIHLPTNGRQRRRNNENGNSDKCCDTSFFGFMLVFSILNSFFQNAWIIYLNDVKEYSYYYMVETSILFVLVCSILYAACVPRKLYIMKIVSIIFAILFIMDLVMIVLVVDGQCYSSIENDVNKLQTKHDCTDIIIKPVLSLFSMFLSTICTLLIYYLKE